MYHRCRQSKDRLTEATIEYERAVLKNYCAALAEAGLQAPDECMREGE